jgi:PAS domain S-box-containing protein
MDTIVIIEPHTMRYLKWNKAATRISGYSDEEFSTMNPFEVFYDEAELHRAEAGVEALMRDGTVTINLTHINKDGSRTTLEYTGAVSRDMGGDPQYGWQ